MEKRFHVYVLIQRASVEGQWTAFAPHFDVVSQGDSIPHAMEMIREATSDIILSDLNGGRDPDDRIAPSECFEELREVIENGSPVRLSDVFEAKEVELVALVVQFELEFRCELVELSNEHGPVSRLHGLLEHPFSQAINAPLHAQHVC